MKHGYILLFSLACMTRCQTANCQPASRIQFPFDKPGGYELIERSRDEFQSSLHTNPLRLEDAISSGSEYVSDADFRWLTDYLTANNVYINVDGLRLMYALNIEKLSNSRGWSSGELTTPSHPVYPPADLQLQAEANKAYSRSSQPDNSSILIFRARKKTLDSLCNILDRRPNLRQSWRDTLAFFTNSILPIVAGHANSVCESLMEYYTLTLSNINQLLDSLLRNPNAQGPRDSRSLRDQEAIHSLIEDFQVPEEMLPPRHASEFSKGQGIKIWFAAYRSVSSGTINSPTNANIYVFKLDKNGRQRHSPEMKAYDIYYGPNGMTYSLTPRCDTLSYFSIHPTNRASALPVVLGKGNYCFILKDVATGRLIMRKNVNLANEAAYDSNHLVRLCFLVNP